MRKAPLIRLGRRELEGGADIFACQLGVFIHDVVGSQALRDQAGDGGDRYAGAGDARLAGHDLLIDSDPLGSHTGKGRREVL
jgi:hypothetical protein